MIDEAKNNDSSPELKIKEKSDANRESDRKSKHRQNEKQFLYFTKQEVINENVARFLETLSHAAGMLIHSIRQYNQPVTLASKSI